MGLREVQAEGHRVIDAAYGAIQQEVEQALAAHGERPMSAPTAAVFAGEVERIVAGHEHALAEELARLVARAEEEGYRHG